LSALLLPQKIESFRRAARWLQVAIERRTLLIVLCDSALVSSLPLADADGAHLDLGR